MLPTKQCFVIVWCLTMLNFNEKTKVQRCLATILKPSATQNSCYLQGNENCHDHCSFCFHVTVNILGHRIAAISKLAFQMMNLFELTYGEICIVCKLFISNRKLKQLVNTVKQFSGFIYKGSSLWWKQTGRQLILQLGNKNTCR